MTSIVAEIGLTHDGSLGNALAMIDACAVAGVDAVKFQCHVGDPVSEFRPGTSFPQDDTRQDYWKRTSFSLSHWVNLAARAKLRNLKFIVSPFSAQAIRFLLGLRIDAWKVPSGLTGNREFLRAVAEECKPVILSTGMSDWIELREAVEVFAGGDITILQCTSAYPCPPEKVGLNVMRELRVRHSWPCKVGLSDHTGQVASGIAAAALGADMLEVHACWSKQQFGPDVSASLTMDELRQLVHGVRFVERMHPVDKDVMSSELTEMRRIFATERSCSK